MNSEMWRVEVPKYSHNNSGFTRLHSKHETQQEAESVSRALLESGNYRFVRIYKAANS